MVKRARSVDLDDRVPVSKRHHSGSGSAAMPASGHIVEAEGVPPRSPDEDLQVASATTGLELGQDMSTKEVHPDADEWAFVKEAALESALKAHLDNERQIIWNPSGALGPWGVQQVDDEEDNEEDPWDLPDMAHSRLGDLICIRSLVDFERAIPQSAQTPPAYIDSEADIQAFEGRFGPGSYALLDQLAASVSPDPDAWRNGHRQYEDLTGSLMGTEPKFAGSAWSMFLLPDSTATTGRDGGDWDDKRFSSLSVKRDGQAPILESGREGYLLTKDDHSYQCVSARKVADATYSLKLSALHFASQIKLGRDPKASRYPCLHPGADRLPPLLSVEVKANAGAQRQTLQQAFYGAWNVYQQLVLRVLAAGSGPSATTAAATTSAATAVIPPNATSATTTSVTSTSVTTAAAASTVSTTVGRIKHYCLGILDDTLEIWEYTPVPDPARVSKSLRIRARLLCKGSVHDQDWFVRIYCPWRRYIAKESIVNHAVSLLPDIEHYTTRSDPRPFDHDRRFILCPREFTIPEAIAGDSLSLSNRMTARFWQEWVQIQSWRFREGYKLPATTKKQKRSSQASSQAESSTQDSSSLASGVPEASGLEAVLGQQPVIVGDDLAATLSVTFDTTTKETPEISST